MIKCPKKHPVSLNSGPIASINKTPGSFGVLRQPESKPAVLFCFPKTTPATIAIVDFVRESTVAVSAAVHSGTETTPAVVAGDHSVIKHQYSATKRTTAIIAVVRFATEDEFWVGKASPAVTATVLFTTK
jgi:hypothetical protein